MNFSVATPCYNGMPHLRRCVGSIRGQVSQGSGDRGQGAADRGQVGVDSRLLTPDSFSVEHLVQDGGSEDGTLDWLGGWAPSGGRTDLPGWRLDWKSGADRGMYDAINRAWERSTGDVLSWLNADEQYLPGTLAAVAEYFRAHPEMDAVFGNYIIVDGEGNPLAVRCEIPLRKTYVVNGLLYAASCTCFYRRRLWDEGLLRLDTSYRYSSDADLVLRLLEQGVKFGHLDRFLSVFGVAGGNLSFSPAMKVEGDGIRRKYGMLPSPWLRRLVMCGRHVEKLLRGCYGRRSVAYGYALDENPNYREFEGMAGTRFEFDWHRGKGEEEES